MSTEKAEAELHYLTIGGRLYVKIGRRLLPVVSGGADGDPGPDDDDDDDDDGDDKTKPKDRTYTQKEVNWMMAREKRQGRKTGIADLLKDLGVENEDGLKKLVKGKQKAAADDGEEVTKLREDHTAAQARAEAAEKKLKDREHQDKIREALLDAGLDAKAARKASRLVEVDADASDDEVVGAVEDLKADMPQLFKASNQSSGNEDDTDTGNDDDRGGSDRQQDRDSDVGAPPRGKKPKEPDAATKANSRLKEMYPKHFQDKSTTNA